MALILLSSLFVQKTTASDAQRPDTHFASTKDQARRTNFVRSARRISSSWSSSSSRTRTNRKAKTGWRGLGNFVLFQAVILQGFPRPLIIANSTLPEMAAIVNGSGVCRYGPERWTGGSGVSKPNIPSAAPGRPTQMPQTSEWMSFSRRIMSTKIAECQACQPWPLDHQWEIKI